MPNTTLRLISDRHRAKKTGDPFRRWLAFALVVISVASAYLIFSRDIDWESRNLEARQLGLTAAHNGNFETARHHFEVALANHPYDWATHLDLANLLFHRLNDENDALRHYLFTLAYSPETALNEHVREKIGILRLLLTGELENPHCALEDMFTAVENAAEPAFVRRLSMDIRGDGADYWTAWTKRGRGSVTNMKIASTHNGFYDAVMELSFPDETAMSMHLVCPLRDTWRVELSFP